MKAFLISALTLFLLTGGALAQATGQPPAPPAQGAAAPPPAPAGGVAATQPPAPPAPGVGPPLSPGGPEAGPDDMGGPPPPPPGGPGPRGNPPPPPPSRAAHFRLQRGDAMVDVKCADDEQMKVCADLTLQMIDRLQTILKP
jgi:hypothetical protein